MSATYSTGSEKKGCFGGRGKSTMVRDPGGFLGKSDYISLQKNPAGNFFKKFLKKNYR
jgi:hypothetical protein